MSIVSIISPAYTWSWCTYFYINRKVESEIEEEEHDEIEEFFRSPSPDITPQVKKPIPIADAISEEKALIGDAPPGPWVPAVTKA